MIHHPLESALGSNPTADIRRTRINKSTYELKNKKYFTFSSLQNKLQLRKALFRTPLYIRWNTGILIFTFACAALVAYVAYASFFANIRQDYGDVETCLSAHIVPLYEVFPQAYPDSTPFRICDTITHETRVYTDAVTWFKNILRGAVGGALVFYALSLLKRAFDRFLAVRTDVLTKRSSHEDIVRAFDIMGYQWNTLRESIEDQYRLYDGSCFDSARQAWDMGFDALVKGDELGQKLDIPVSKYLVSSDSLATDERRKMPLKAERDAAMVALADKAAIRMFPMLISEVNRTRRAEDEREGRTTFSDGETVEESTRAQEEVSVAAHIAAAEAVEI